MAALMNTCIYAEYNHLLSLLRVNLCSAWFSKANSSEVEFHIGASVLELVTDNDKEIFLFGDLTLLPETCRGLSYKSHCNALQFSVQVEREAVYMVKTSPNRRPDVKLQDQMLNSILTNQNRCYCSVCGQKLLSDGTRFNNIYPLPSEDWSNLTDIWFCHQHDDQSESPSCVSMVPRSHDCHVGDIYFLIDSCHVMKGAVMETDYGVCCGRCRSVVGEVRPFPSKNGHSTNCSRTIYQLFWYAVTFGDHKDNDYTEHNPLITRVETLCAQYLMEQSQLFTSFKFLISSRQNDRVVHLMLWMVDPRVTLFISRRNVGEDPGFSRVQGHCAVKLLFQVHGLSSKQRQKAESVYQQWKGDNSVQQLTLPHSLMLQLISILIQNCEVVPKYMRQFEQLMLSHLKYTDT